MNIVSFALIIGGWWIKAPDQAVTQICQLLKDNNYAKLEAITLPKDRWILILLEESDLEPEPLTWTDWFSGVRRFRVIEFHEDGPLAKVSIRVGHLCCEKMPANQNEQGPRVLGNGRDHRLIRRLSHPDGWLHWTIAATPNDGAVAEKLFLVTLNRRPTDEEYRLIDEHFNKVNDRQVAAEDVVWTLLQSKEFHCRGSK